MYVVPDEVFQKLSFCTNRRNAECAHDGFADYYGGGHSVSGSLGRYEVNTNCAPKSVFIDPLGPLTAKSILRSILVT